MEAERLGLERTPVLYRGKLPSVHTVRELLGTESFLGGPQIEGVVIKGIVPEYVMLGGNETRLLIKYVSEAFKEVHKTNWKADYGHARGDIVTRVAAGLATPARWQKAVQRMAEAGTLTDSPKDIGQLIALVKADIKEEEGDRLRQAMFDDLIEGVLKQAVAGLPEWYKDKLMGEALGD